MITLEVDAPSAAQPSQNRPVPSLRVLVAESAMRVAPEHFGALPPAGEIVDAYFDGDALVVEMELDPELEHDYMRVPRSVADELAATIARPEQAVWCRVHWRNITGPHPASPSPD